MAKTYRKWLYQVKCSGNGVFDRKKSVNNGAFNKSSFTHGLKWKFQSGTLYGRKIKKKAKINLE